MTDLSAIDYFRSAVTADPFPFLDALVQDHPVWIEPRHGVAMVSGYEQCLSVMRDPDTFSSANIVAGPTPDFPEKLTGDDVSEQLERYRDDLPMSDQITAFDPPKHTAHRALLMGLITPKRLKENEDFMWRLADRQLDEVLPLGRCELINDFAHPYTLLVIADLLGVPESDHPSLLNRIGSGQAAVSDHEADDDHAGHPSLKRLYDYFIASIEDRRREPKGDILTAMAQATYPDGTVPEPVDVARIASNLFAAGQETTVRLLGTVIQLIGDRPELQATLRANRELIPRFVEETLRLEGPIPGLFRIARRTTQIGGVPIPAGTVLWVTNSAANRDPRQFEDPARLWVERPNARRHIAFGLGAHTCPGAPLARSEVRIGLERLFDRSSEIVISADAHGPAGARHYDYMPTYMFRGLTELHVEFRS